MTGLSEKALNASCEAYDKEWLATELHSKATAAAIRTYIESATPPDVAGLVAELENSAAQLPKKAPAAILYRQAATALRLSAGGGWRTIDSAPKDGQSFMVYVAESDMGPHCFAPVSRDTGGDWWDDSTGDCIEPIKGATHWQPLPASPTVEAGHVE